MERLPIPDACVVGNHDRDDAEGADAFTRVHAPANFTFASSHARFVGLPADVQAFDRAGTAERRFGEAPAA